MVEYVALTRIGNIRITQEDDWITGLCTTRDCADGGGYPTPLIRSAFEQLDEYLSGGRAQFDLPLRPAGTEFQKRVFKALAGIPYGQTRSYKKIAQELGSPNAARAVGMANHKNPIMIFIPCHRVIGSNGALTGFAGGLDLKQKLLNLEQNGK